MYLTCYSHVLIYIFFDAWASISLYVSKVSVKVVVLLFKTSMVNSYGHIGTVSQPNNSIPGQVRVPKPLTNTKCTFWKLPFLSQWEGKWKNVARLDMEPRTSDTWVRCATNCTTRPSTVKGLWVAGFKFPNFLVEGTLKPK